jgi:RNA polymerase sigma-70 factor, ECF subfamily
MRPDDADGIESMAPVVESTDQSLLARFRLGSDDAATRLYFRYARQLRSLAQARLGTGLATRVDADDVVQSVFRTFFRRARLGQFVVPQGSDLWKLFLVIALNKIRTQATHHRAAKRDVRKTPQFEQQPDVGGPADDSHVVLRMVIDELLGQLPTPQRTVIELRIAGHEVDQIAQQVGCSLRSVERWLQKFRAALTSILEDDSDEVAR